MSKCIGSEIRELHHSMAIFFSGKCIPFAEKPPAKAFTHTHIVFIVVGEFGFWSESNEAPHAY